MTYHDRAGLPYNFIHLLVFRYWAIMSCGFIDGWVLSTSLWATTVNGPKFNLPHLSKDLSNVFRGYCNVKNRCLDIPIMFLSCRHFPFFDQNDNTSLQLQQATIFLTAEVMYVSMLKWP